MMSLHCNSLFNSNAIDVLVKRNVKQSLRELFNSNNLKRVKSASSLFIYKNANIKLPQILSSKITLHVTARILVYTV